MERLLGASVERLGLGGPGRQLDLALAAGAVLLNVVGALQPDPELAYDLRVGLLPALAGAAAGIALFWRRSHALAVFSFVVVAAFVATVLHWASAIPVTLFLAGYALGAYATLSASAAGLALAAALFAAMFLLRTPYFDSPLGLFAVAEVFVSWLVGRAIAHRRQLADRARARRVALARDGAEEAERVRVSERLRMARMLHGKVSASLAAVIEHATAARGSGTLEPDTLAEIERAGRTAADDLRRMLGTLRDPDERPASSAATVQGPADWPVDVAIGLGVVALNVGGSLLPETSSARETAEPVLPMLLALSVVPGLALMLRRLMPVTVLAVVFAVIVTVFWLDWPEGNIPAALVIATYALGAWTPVGRGAAALLVMYAAMITLASVGPASLVFEWTMLLIFTPPWIVGVAIRWRRIRDRADIDASLAAEAEQAAAIQRALLDERLAVARDLHDVVSHNLSGIVIQVAAARRRVGGADQRLLGVVEDAGRAALAGLHKMVEALESKAGRQPAPGLPELQALVARYEHLHGPVDLTIDPVIEGEPESTRMTVFRIVQEALTNVAKHAAGAHTSVAVFAAEDGVRVVVENDAGHTMSVVPGSGAGLAGMRERVALFGGEFQAGVNESGGFQIRARLPREVPV